MRGFRVTLLKLLVFFVVSGFAGVIVYATLDGPAVGDTDTYHATFADVSGLRAGDAVKVSGVEVGSVESIDLRDATHADVTFTANRNQTLTTTTFAVVRYANLLGQRFLALTQDDRPGTLLRAGATIPQSRTAPAVSLTALFNGFRPLFRALDAKQVNTFSSQIIRILQGEGGTIEDLISQTAQLTGNLAQRDQVIVSIVDNLGAVLRTVASHDTQLRQTVDSLTQLTRNLAADTPNIGRSIDAVDRLAGSVRTLVGGLNRRDIAGTVIDIERITSVLAKNTPTLDRTIKAFPAAFADLNRVSQNGNWINAYACALTVRTPLPMTLSLRDIARSIAKFLGDKAGSLTTIITLLGGLLPNQKLVLPIKTPEGRLDASPEKNSPVCR